jgi:integrase
MPDKRSNGEGTISRRKNGTFEGAVYVLSAGGGRKRVHVYGKTRVEVDEKLTAAKRQSQQGVPVPDRERKVGEYLDYWLKYAVRSKRRPLTYRRSESIVRLYLRPGLGKCVLHRLSVQTVQEFIDQLYVSGVSEASLFQVRKVLSASLTYAMRQELVVRNVARLVELPTYQPNEAPHWTAAEATRFLRAAEADPLYPAFVLLLLYGLRSGEVLGLRWSDVDFELGVLRVRQQVQRIEGKLQQVQPKTRTSERDEPLLATAQEILRAQQVNQVAAQAAAGDSWQGAKTGEGLVFTTRSGRPVESHNLSRSFLRICKQHHLQRITLHGLRHTNATVQKNLNVHARDIQAILGHGDVRTTGIYEHVELSSKREALEKVEHRIFESAMAAHRCGCRNSLSYDANIVSEFTSLYFGGSSQTRTGDTRLFRARDMNIRERLRFVEHTMEARTRSWKFGSVVVNVVVSKEVVLAGKAAAESMLNLRR